MDKPLIAAGIDIGSNAIKMLIAELAGPGQLRILEDVKLTSPIGDDTFTHGQIHSKATFEVCRAMKQMSQLMKDYKVKTYRACATSGVREASNRGYFLDNLRRYTDMDIELVDSSVERYLTYIGLNIGVEQMPQLREEGLLVVEIGSAGVQLSVYASGKLQFSEYVRIGILKLKEVLDSLRGESLHYSNVLQQYIESQLDMLRRRMSSYTIKHLIVLGGEASTLAHKYGERGTSSVGSLPLRSIARTTLQRHMFEWMQAGTAELSHKFHIDEERASQLVPTAIIMSELLKGTAAERLLLPDVSLRHGVLHEMSLSAHDQSAALQALYIEDMTASAFHAAERVQLDMEHSRQVRRLAKKLFDRLNSLFRMDPSRKLCLELAAILHDIGKTISQEGHAANSYHMIKAMDWLGLSEKDKELVASMALYHPRSAQVPLRPDMSEQEQLVLSKLTSILKLADALDIAHLQKVKDFTIHIKKGTYITLIPTYEGSLELERWAFQHESSFFEQVSGYPILLKG
ncbi:hypothetical protein AZ66_26360 [Paenibacillus sp. E194]|nr:HD domain-containing protein [Paenibacillus sp. E194]KJB85155.1 hypothetical protein AZ66_26360 [Paenibacillus sp. E194]